MPTPLSVTLTLVLGLHPAAFPLAVPAGPALFPPPTGHGQDTPPAPARPTVSERRVRVSGGVMAGFNLTQVPPVYPPEAKARGIAGTVVLAVVVDAEGKVADVQPISGPDLLRSSALEAVRQWTYRPYMLNGQPVAVNTTVTVNFQSPSVP